MPKDHRPRFSIYRIDPPVGEDRQTPDTHYRAFWKIEGKLFRVRVWSRAQWERRSREGQETPAGARSLNGRGWMLLQPIDRKS